MDNKDYDDDFYEKAELLPVPVEYRGKENVEHSMKRTLFIIFLSAFLVSIGTIGFASIWVELSNELPIKRNVILMISDGFGPASETFARDYYQYVNDLHYNYTTSLDQILVGLSRTRSSNCLVTDSAAGATAFSCVKKTYNGAIAVDPDKVPCGTVLEAAKAIGMATGLVVTSRITHATPASFSSHVISRDMEDIIAIQQLGDYPLGRQVDLMIGGGRCYFLPNSTVGSCRGDDRDLITEAEKSGFTYFSSRKEFDDIDPESQSIPLLGLFTLDHMSYEIDRVPSVEPSLKEMSEKAIRILEAQTAHSDKGFFLMIEGSRIDMAGHANDPGAHVHEILAYHQAIEFVTKYVDDHPGTVLISVSDHETGGLSLSRQTNASYPQYLWYPDVISRIKNSSYALSMKLTDYWKDDRTDYVKDTILRNSLGISDFTDDEVNFLVENQTRIDYEYYMANLTSWRARLGWTTHGHTGVDVSLFAYGINTGPLHGNHEVIYIDYDRKVS
ncbi:6047_t:CDS:10 [Cetraspora pellucida]|uniref:Alkaline phosphatase n=1 Tax=Cetraspora pellucida TaxID=1433469 RepID=A0A9N9CMG6_9GLOM|nr:6047_t:CDS:10 [Cetraspora pellucida]